MACVDVTNHHLPSDEARGGGGGGVVALELGAGCAVPSLVLAKRLSSLRGTSSASPSSPPPIARHKVYASDWNDEVLDNIRHNLKINGLAPEGEDPQPPSPSNDLCECFAIRMDWNDPSSWEPWSASEHQKSSSAPASSTPTPSIDHDSNPRKPCIIVGADLIYQPSMVEPLVGVIVRLLDRDDPRARFYYVAPLTAPRSGGPELIRRLLEEFRLVQSAVAPASMKRNPLKSQDDDECFLHFQELLTSDFRLYEFACK
jgi:hypothetical protein